MNKKILALAVSMAFSHAYAQSDVGSTSNNENATVITDAEVQALKERIDQLESLVDERIEAMADAIESGTQERETKAVSIGGYGELHYNNLQSDFEDETRELDFHRMVLFFGYEFNSKMRFVTEFEIEHIIASQSERGAVELEQAFVEFDLNDRMQLQTGVMLVPIGIINETHEPPTFYGVERPVVEVEIIPTTWWSAGVKFNHSFTNGFKYEVMFSEGLFGEDPEQITTGTVPDPFDLRAAKQKSSFATAYDFATTVKASYVGIPGLELAAYAQYQPDLDQSADRNYAGQAILSGGHVIYNYGPIETRALYTRWDLGGQAAEEAGRDVQEGGYLEVSWKAFEDIGFFVRQSEWSNFTDLNESQTDIGVNYWVHPDIVFKAQAQMQNDDAGDEDGFSLGFGYQF